MTEKPINDGGPAFPNPALADPGCHFQADVTGVSVRQWFAGQALSAVVADPNFRNFQIRAGETWSEMVARVSFSIADAMIAEGAK